MRIMSSVAAEIRAALLCLCSAVCCVSGQSAPEHGDACPSPLWVQFHSSCYTFVHVTQNSLSVEPARDLCKDIGADLISISSQEENSFLVKTFQTKWKGPTEVLLGIFYDSDDNSLKWYDKSDVSFLNWGQEQSEDYNLNTCVKMNTQSGRWDVTDCDQFKESAVLCKHVSKESRIVGRKAMNIALIATFTVITLVLPLVLIFLHKRRRWSNRLHSADILPYSDDAVLVDTMEREDYT
ncbi:CD302 antigen [Anomaloglossus baeobatrachus]|uniref:CD302 antigen n=1 Tax=Anomaloglossus baeobatrachus TaxID=238106 RepID=UPI003F4FAE02